MDILRKVEQTICDERLFDEGDSVMVAVSGGPDSIALLHILFLLSAKWKWRLVVAHVNHRFRGKESDSEAVFVQAVAAQLGLACEVGRPDVPAYIRETGLNPQEAAREKRYDFLQETASRHQCLRIATAHHADDQAETVLMHMLRGSGPGGLGGIPFTRAIKNMELVRPFLRITKRELLFFCKQHELPYCEDSSNRKTDYVRNRVRLELMPVLRTYNPRLTETLLRLADTMREEEAFMSEAAEAVFARIALQEENGWRFSAASCAELPVALQRRFVKLILGYLSADMADFNTVEVVREAVLQLRTPSLARDLAGGLRLVREYDAVRVVRPSSAEEAGEGFFYEWPMPLSTLDIPEAGIRLQAEFYGPEAPATGQSGLDEVWFDAEQVIFPLTVRSRQAGDRIRLFGLNGSKKVKDILIDAKIPPSARNRLPLLFDATGVLLWIPGLRRSDEALITNRTRRQLRLTFHSDDGDSPVE